MMKQQWDVNDIIEHFTLLAPEVSFLGMNDPHNQLGKALLLKFFQHEGRFPESASEIPLPIIEYVAQQLSLPHEVIDDYNWDGRTIKRHTGDRSGNCWAFIPQLSLTNGHCGPG